ncbi:hypothetical protein M885DRAFT_527333 [Pelagophyceae sp. CCMP2097]|nr:hypothetical protein M885DRAFT_527333 [Pelagophyceae sp. CCMP2097]
MATLAELFSPSAVYTYRRLVASGLIDDDSVLARDSKVVPKTPPTAAAAKRPEASAELQAALKCALEKKRAEAGDHRRAEDHGGHPRYAEERAPDAPRAPALPAPAPVLLGRRWEAIGNFETTLFAIVKAGAPAADTRELLNLLSRHDALRAPELRASRLPKLVGALRKHADARVAELAKGLVASWKRTAEDASRNDASPDDGDADARAERGAPAAKRPAALEAPAGLEATRAKRPRDVTPARASAASHGPVALSCVSGRGASAFVRRPRPFQRAGAPPPPTTRPAGSGAANAFWKHNFG